MEKTKPMIKRILAGAFAALLLSTSAFAQGAITKADVETVAVTSTAASATFATLAQNAPGSVIIRNDGAVTVFVDFGRTAVQSSATAIPVAACEGVVVNFVGNRPLYASLVTAASTSSVRVLGVYGAAVPSTTSADKQVSFVKNDGCATNVASQSLPMTGASVASATALPVPTGRLIHVTGTTNITSVLATGIATGQVVTLIFDGILTFTDGNNLKLAGNLVTTADDTITIAYDGTNWYEVARSVN